jgi:predicted metal-dependent hydrolase
LPYGSEGVERIPDDLQLSAAESLDYAQQLLDRGLAFHAHEVLEAAWKNAPDVERTMWQGLAQLAVGITHIQRGNPAGAAAVLQRAADRLTNSDRTTTHDVDVAGLVDHAQRLIDDLTRNADIDAERLAPRLRAER